MQDKDDILSKTIGCILVNLMSVDYNQWLAMHFQERGKKYNYITNKLNQAAKASELVSQQLAVVDSASREYVVNQANMFSDLIFELTNLPPSKINRVKNLIEKLKKEQ